MISDPQCRLCTLQGYERVAQSAHFYTLTGEGREEPLFIVPRAHIELMELHELFAAEMWGLIRTSTRPHGGMSFISGANAGGHGYLAVSLMRDADDRWKALPAQLDKPFREAA